MQSQRNIYIMNYKYIFQKICKPTNTKITTLNFEILQRKRYIKNPPPLVCEARCPLYIEGRP